MLSLAEALAALPDTADGIAAHLTEKGIRGARKDDCACPIANWLTGFADWDLPTVTENILAVYDSEGAELWAHTPAHVHEFIRRFDRGDWPELVASDV